MYVSIGSRETPSPPSFFSYVVEFSNLFQSHQTSHRSIDRLQLNFDLTGAAKSYSRLKLIEADRLGDQVLCIWDIRGYSSRTREKSIQKMRLPMVDCRSLIEFCKAFEQHQNSYQRNNTQVHSRGHHISNKKQTNSLAHPFCEHSPLAAIDVVLLLVVLGALGFLTSPYLIFVAHEVLPIISYLLVEAISNAPVWYVVGLILAFTVVIVTIAVWEFLDMQSRKCGKPFCKGLRKAVEFDIQLESEECVKYLAPIPTTAYGMKPLELGDDHKELEAELKRMAPLNGRTVLIFRAPCGCPAGRLEVWGPKKIRRVKK